LDPAHSPALTEVITTLLRDTSPLSIGAVAIAFDAVCPNRLELLHIHYRRLCQVIVDVDEWGQISLMTLLMRYARTMVRQPNSRQVDGIYVEDIDDDLHLLLRCVEPLLQSRNPAVVVSVTRLLLFCNVESQMPKVVSPMLRLLHGSPEVERVVLHYLLDLPDHLIEILSPLHSRFFLRSTDTQATKLLKIKLLLRLNRIEIYQVILRELIDYTDDPDDTIISAAVQAIGSCTSLVPDCASQSLSALQAMVQSNSNAVVSASIVVLKQLIHTRGQNSISKAHEDTVTLSTIASLAHRLDEIKNPEAKACAIWLVGQYSSSPASASPFAGVAEFAPDVLRKCIKTFLTEPASVKLQIVTLAAKLLVLCPSESPLLLMAQYISSLARFDRNYDVRDRSRILFSLIAGISGSLSQECPSSRAGVVLRREQLRLILFNGKTQSNVRRKTSFSFTRSIWSHLQSFW
jgi:AP-3 complex subunit beta